MHNPCDFTLQRFSRREAFSLLAASATLATSPKTKAFEAPFPRCSMGLVVYDFNLRQRWLRQNDPNANLFEPETFLAHCKALGAGGMQASLGVLAPEQSARLRSFAESNQLYIEAIVRAPRDKLDIERFESEIKTARDCNALAARTTIIPGRRYEQFKTLEEFRAAEKAGRRCVELAIPIVQRHRVPLAIENHKDQRLDERVALLNQISNEYIGACVDTGNNFALLDDPYEAVTALAPFAFSIHLKDQALQRYDDGFLLADISLGQGSFNLNRFVQPIRLAKPNVRFSLELITRDPLKVPCLRPDYWATMPNVPALELARALAFVRENECDSLPHVSSLALAQQVQLEAANVQASLQYAREHLDL